ncbi:MAG: hypothetical protein H6Q68_2142 [Firmicutes bacterium]|nr:hypothetical protein [Bacillota bacterium]
MSQFSSLCNQFANIIGGTPKSNEGEGVCSVSLVCKDIRVMI